jgi:hypothetical protein
LSYPKILGLIVAHLSIFRFLNSLRNDRLADRLAKLNY